MFRDEFKERYTTIPFAIHRTRRVGHLLPHQHKEVELIAMIEGAADFHIDARCYRVEVGEVLVIPPYAIHRAEAVGGYASYNCICFDLDLLWDKDLREGLVNHTLTVEGKIDGKLPYADTLQKLIENSCTACENQSTGWELEVIGSMSLLFGILKRNGLFISRTEGKTENAFAQNVMNYIVERHTSPITSTTVSAAFYMNHSYFCRLFKKHFGCCFSAYLLGYRLEKAKIYLRNTRLTVTEISQQTGFSSQSYFGQAFKERFGVSPLALRKQINTDRNRK
ncbi:MAG: helix-turn-helix transcriptional regulator [Clostridia bacterium]|nr:helix-turn-helix transcriptional regulator [Clostridia bacterium]